VLLSHLLKPEHVFLDIPARTREEVLVYVAEHLEQAGAVRRSQDLVDLLLDRERLHFSAGKLPLPIVAYHQK